MKPTGLPIEEVADEVAAALAEAGLAVVVAPPGSGKTTVLPLHLLDAPWLDGGRIVVLEPRRVAARAAARRMAELLGEDVGGTVGYVTRTDRATTQATRLEVVTEGIVTRRLQRRPDLPGTGLLIFDEIHERNLHTDLGLALALDARSGLRPDLRLLAMSATIDATPIARLLGGEESAARVIAGGHRSHPVDVHWAPRLRRVRLAEHTAAVVRRALSEQPGDVLVFLPGMADIIRTRRLLEGAAAEVDILHGSLPTADQDRALRPAPGGRRRVVLSTDIAETSITVEGVGVVVDTGLARAPRFDARTGMTRLHTVPVSRASAEQRSGRAGRLGPGAAYRLWSKMEHGSRRPHIDPEITQVDLAGFALELAAWGARDVESLRFLDAPPPRSLTKARSLLRLLGALDEHDRLTPVGETLTGLPVHPRLGRMIVAAGEDAYLACALAALLDDRDVLRGHPDEVPVDLGTRVRLLVDRRSRHPLADRSAMTRARATTDDLARRAGVETGGADPDAAGRTLALAFPDRLAIHRGGPGRFQLRTGTTAWLDAADALAREPFIVAADLDGKRKDARIRLAAAIAGEDVAARFSADVLVRKRLVWRNDRLVERRERTLGGIVLDEHEGKPEPGPGVVAALVGRLRDDGIDEFPWSGAARALVARIAFLRTRFGTPWPDWTPAHLPDLVAGYLAERPGEVRGLEDVSRLDVARLLRQGLPHPQAADLDRLAPTHVTVPSGRRIRLDYSGEAPSLAVRVQEMFGATRTPTVAGIPVVLHLLSPANRPVQITADLAGFWQGSWESVRRDMAGRYPKHDWPEDAAAAEPRRP